MDEFDVALEERTKALRECQVSKGFVKLYDGEEYSTCIECVELVGCAIRGAYVSAVYNSMSKGATGGFEF